MSVRAVPIAPLTRWDYQELPDGGPRYELLEGELVISPSPSRRHQTILGNIGFLFASYLRGKTLGVVYFAPLDVFLSETTVVQPDLLFISSDRSHRLQDHGIEGAPDLVVEILSPATRKRDAVVKKNLYLRLGVQELWLVDPDSEQVAIYHLNFDANHPRLTLSQGDTYTSPLLPGLTFAIRECFLP